MSTRAFACFHFRSSFLSLSLFRISFVMWHQFSKFNILVKIANVCNFYGIQDVFLVSIKCIINGLFFSLKKIKWLRTHFRFSIFFLQISVSPLSWVQCICVDKHFGHSISLFAATQGKEFKKKKKRPSLSMECRCCVHVTHRIDFKEKQDKQKRNKRNGFIGLHVADLRISEKLKRRE